MPVGLDARESYIFGKRMASGEWTNISTIRCFSEQRIAEANAVTAADLPKRPRVFYAISYIQPNSLALIGVSRIPSEAEKLWEANFAVLVLHPARVEGMGNEFVQIG
jgi:hypothetical protein